jgi:hypothetical protein
MFGFFSLLILIILYAKRYIQESGAHLGKYFIPNARRKRSRFSYNELKQKT